MATCRMGYAIYECYLGCLDTRVERLYTVFTHIASKTQHTMCETGVSELGRISSLEKKVAHSLTKLIS